MTKLRIIVVVAVCLGMLAPDAMAQRRGGGGAVSSGVRGAMVGGLVGGESGAQKGAKIGAVAGVTRTVAQNVDQRQAVNTEAQARAQYQTTAEYQNAPHSDFNTIAPEILVTSAVVAGANTQTVGKPVISGAPKKDDSPVETVIRKDGKPVLGVTYPSDWKRKIGDHSVAAVTADGQGWSAVALLDGIKDKEAGIAKAKQGIEKSLQDVKYDDPTTTERGALMVTGTGKGKKTGVEVVFAIGVFESGPSQISGAAFLVDKDVEDHYKDTVRYICGTIRGEKDLAQPKETAK